MEDRSLPRIVVIALSVLIYISALAINALAGAGKGEFHVTYLTLTHVNAVLCNLLCFNCVALPIWLLILNCRTGNNVLLASQLHIILFLSRSFKSS